LAVAEKPSVSEMAIAGQFVLHIGQTVQESWPQISGGLRTFFRNDPTVLDGDIAAFEFALAVVATQIQALPNLLLSDQAARIRSHVVRCLCSDEIGTYPAEAIDEYQAAWGRSLEMAEPPYFGIAYVLFDKLGASETSSVGGAVLLRPASRPPS
jgi:hypothetical protein